MAAKKTATKRTGTKKTTRETAGKTARVTGTFKVPRTAKQLAAAIRARMKRSPGYWMELREAMDAGAGRVAQVEPREAAAPH